MPTKKKKRKGCCGANIWGNSAFGNRGEFLLHKWKLSLQMFQWLPIPFSNSFLKKNIERFGASRNRTRKKKLTSHIAGTG